MYHGVPGRIGAATSRQYLVTFRQDTRNVHYVACSALKCDFGAQLPAPASPPPQSGGRALVRALSPAPGGVRVESGGWEGREGEGVPEGVGRGWQACPAIPFPCRPRRPVLPGFPAIPFPCFSRRPAILFPYLEKNGWVDDIDDTGKVWLGSPPPCNARRHLN